MSDTLTFDLLSLSMQRALVDIVIRGGMEWEPGVGWDGTGVHQSRTVRALVRRRLLRISQSGSLAAAPTAAGRNAVSAAIGDFNGGVAFLDRTKVAA